MLVCGRADGQISRADTTSLSPSEDHTCDQPSDGCAESWTADTTSQLCEAFCFSATKEELEDSHHYVRHIEDETPQEPSVELRGDIHGVSSGLRVLWHCFGWVATCPALFTAWSSRSVWVLERINVEEVAQNAIDDEVAASLDALALGIFLRLHLLHGVLAVQH